MFTLYGLDLGRMCPMRCETSLAMFMDRRDSFGAVFMGHVGRVDSWRLAKNEEKTRAITHCGQLLVNQSVL